MTRTSFALFTAVTLSALLAGPPRAASEEPSKEAKIARAVSAAPPSVGKEATVMDFDGTVLRKGTNGWHCMPGIMPGDDHPMCNDAVWTKLMAAVGSKGEFKTDRIGISYMLQGDSNVNNADPFDTKQDPGEMWVQEGPHMMIVTPDTKMLEGLPDDPNQGGPYVMWKGTPYAHIMVPTAPRTGK